MGLLQGILRYASTSTSKCVEKGAFAVAERQASGILFASTPLPSTSFLGGGAKLQGRTRSRLLSPAWARRALSSGCVALQQAVAAEVTSPGLSLRDRIASVPTSLRTKDTVSMKANLIFDSCWRKMEQRLKDVSTTA